MYGGASISQSISQVVGKSYKLTVQARFSLGPGAINSQACLLPVVDGDMSNTFTGNAWSLTNTANWQMLTFCYTARQAHVTITLMNAWLGNPEPGVNDHAVFVDDMKLKLLGQNDSCANTTFAFCPGTVVR